MSSPTPAELASHALDSLDGAGWVSVVRDRSASVVLPRGGQLRTGWGDRTEVTFTSWRDGHLGAATTSATDGAALAAAARRAVRTADAVARAADGPGDATPPPEPAVGLPHDGYDEATAEADPTAGLEAIAAVRSAVADRAPVSASWHHGAVTHALAASTGLALLDRTTDAHLRVRAGAGGVRSAVAAESARAAADLDATSVALRALGRIPGGEWHDASPGEQTVVLAPEAVAAVLAVAARLVFDGFAAADGRTTAAGRLGSRVAAAGIGIVDDPLAAGTLPRAFDASGTPKAALTLVRDGVLEALVHDGRSERSTGHAVAPGGDPYGPRTTNLVLAAGDAADLDALVAGVDVGLLVTSIEDLRPINAELGLAYGLAADGAARIVGGRAVGAAGSVPLLVSPLEVLGGIDALTATRLLVGSPTLDGRRLGHGAVVPGVRTHSGIIVTD